MSPTIQKLLTPIYLKLAPDMPWPEDPVFHLLTRDGLFLCRNHRFFRSSVPTDAFPSELASHTSFVKLSYPKIPQRLFETVIGYFSLVADAESAEAAVVLVWNATAEAVEVIVPEQTSYVSIGWRGRRYPVEVHYEIPPLPQHLRLIGDIHSHVDGPAYASFMDQHDERHRPGLHLVVGRIFDEPPQLHAEITVDGVRCKVTKLEAVVEGYQTRRPGDVPQDWLDKVTIKEWKSYAGTGSCSSKSTWDPEDSAIRRKYESLPPAAEIPDAALAAKPEAPEQAQPGGAP